MKKLLKGMLLVFVILYVVSPLDACPGPIDDLILLLITWAANRGGEVITDKR